MGCVMNTTERPGILNLQEVMPQVSASLTSERSLSALYINCSSIGRIEVLCGKKIYLDIIRRVHGIIEEMRGTFIRQEDVIVSRNAGGEEYVVFLAKKRAQEEFCPTDLESLCGRVTEHLNKSIFPVAFPHLRSGPKITVGYAVIIHNPLIREERLLNKLIDDARRMSEYQEFKRVMRYKEKLQELILKESIRTLFQPIVDLQNSSILGYEALTRGPEGTEFENPYLLFDAAAESDLLFELDRLCRKKALQNAREMAPGTKLFLNCLPSMVLDPEFRDAYLRVLLDEMKLSPFDIVFEITEREAIENYDLFNQAIRYYTDLGFAIAVDDTGAGYSSLETVVELKPHFVKIDMSLVRGIDKNMLKQGLIKAIYDLTCQMGSLVVAEGIETREELETLRSIGIHLGQGYLFSRPGLRFPEIDRAAL